MGDFPVESRDGFFKVFALSTYYEITFLYSIDRGASAGRHGPIGGSAGHDHDARCSRADTLLRTELLLRDDILQAV